MSSKRRHTLGAIISPNGMGSHQLCHSLARAKEFQGKLKNAGLPQMAQWLTVLMVVEPAVT